MKAIIIKITVTDPDMMKDYRDVHSELIAADFINDPSAWIYSYDGTTVEATKE